MNISLASFRRALRIERLRLRINSYSYQLHSIHMQRENDFKAECLIHKEMSLAKSDLKRLQLSASARSTATAGTRDKRQAV
jgi:hypothetical protein